MILTDQYDTDAQPHQTATIQNSNRNRLQGRQRDVACASRCPKLVPSFTSRGLGGCWLKIVGCCGLTVDSRSLCDCDVWDLGYVHLGSSSVLLLENVL
jgi:hypothetical protein